MWQSKIKWGKQGGNAQIVPFHKDDNKQECVVQHFLLKYPLDIIESMYALTH